MKNKTSVITFGNGHGVTSVVMVMLLSSVVMVMVLPL